MPLRAHLCKSRFGKQRLKHSRNTKTLALRIKTTASLIKCTQHQLFKLLPCCTRCSPPIIHFSQMNDAARPQNALQFLEHHRPGGSEHKAHEKPSIDEI